MLIHQQIICDVNYSLHREMFMTELIQAYEERSVACFDIPGSYLNAETDKDIVMVLERPLVELMFKVHLSL